MKVVYLGCDGAPEVSTHYGVEFTIGQPAEVADAAALAKLAGHPHFQIVGESEAPVEADSQERDEVVAMARAAGIRIGRKSVETLKRELSEVAHAVDH